MIDVNEQGRMRPLLERMAQTNSKINLSRPIRLSTLNSAFETMRNSRSQGRNSRGRSEPELEPLVAGFDDFEEYADIPGFGDDARLYDIPTTAADKKEAQRQISRADRNKDGVLDAQEVRRVGNWTSDPWKNDRNGDKKLTVAELAVRYAVRRMDRVKNGKSSNSRTRQTSSRTRGGTSRTSSRGGTTNNRMAGFMDTIFARYDRNRSGYLEKSEWSSFRSDPSAADKNKDSRISKKEFSDFMGSRFSRGGQQGGRTRGGGQTSRGGGMFTRGGGMTRGGTSRGGGDTGGRGRFGRGGGDTGGRGRFTRGGDTGGRGRFSRGGQSGGGRMMMMGGGRGLAGGRGSSGRGAPAEPAKSKGYKQSSPIDNLPDGLPSWYERNDANTDGQIAMHEFASKWDNRVLENFYEFDLNKDGLITPKEALEGVDQGARRGDYGSSSSGRSRDSRSSRSSRNSKSRRGSRDSKSASSSSSKTKSASANGPAKYIKAASGYLKSMDKNGDGSLDATEQANMKFYKKSDHNKDGKITVEELAKTMADSRK